jgi:hypothetical protein
MSISEVNLASGQAAIASLESALSVLKKIMLSSGQCEPLLVMKVPFRGKPEVNSHIELVVPSSDEEALAWAVDSLTSTRWVGGQHPKETMRCPGVLVVSDKVIAAAIEVNKAKAELKRVIDNIPARERIELYRSVNRFSSLQALRLIEMEKEMSSVTFRWNFTFSTDRKACASVKSELLLFLSEFMGTEITEGMLSTQTNNSEMYKVATDFVRLAKIPDKEILASVRQIQRHIRAYISPKKKLVNSRFVGKGYYIQAKTPILTMDSVNVTASEMTDYSGALGTQKFTSGSFEEEPLIERLDLFRYIKPKRIYELPEKINSSRMKGGNYLEVKDSK